MHGREDMCGRGVCCGGMHGRGVCRERGDMCGRGACIVHRRNLYLYDTPGRVRYPTGSGILVQNCSERSHGDIFFQTS